MKVCLVSSTGGHLNQLLNLVPAVEDHDYFLVTEKSEASSKLNLSQRTYFLSQQERKNMLFIFIVLRNIITSLFILLKERPKVLITTGAGAVYPLCLLGKLMGAKLVYVESYAKIYSPTLTGRLIYKFADEFYIQWETLQEAYPKAKYRGALF
ncbi:MULTISPECIES: PssD/Cps14F family polysaccharide biosynthesis glycosyltransferase [Paenibacillus]|uniref:UDP-N-acetylglucosamine:LPS N-acetylglucosamine transferase n=1 Tax=Paenibacillus amylolyticus TaxID=1451 RepID=A0AAP5H175_PAEAM|nr:MULTISPECIES: PssD/Cps14F family polysaccharide biosynthesis glycosyltransferase [Paenibacillus]KQY91664.1 polysaccharide biosynthesis protein [Paenibacillus sp. Root52]MCG7377536.1 polysaccharide biosynthesis protein [Paenibacillus sp. ACRSA]MCM3174499.1 UDP-N-acetylglucosamine transferase subunit ALG14 [Paenibacillus sp. MER 99-2]MDR6724017.1 UDP-N-acetylglucosamine:LPS N-acetylglucosamine transferase [Paenibacillus amylolyticus]